MFGEKVCIVDNRRSYNKIAKMVAWFVHSQNGEVNMNVIHI